MELSSTMRAILLALASVRVAYCLHNSPANHYRLQQLTNIEVRHNRKLEIKLKDRFNFINQLTSRKMQITSIRSPGSTREDYIGHPLPALGMVRRLVEEWPSLVGMIGALSHLGLGELRWPTQRDLSAVALTVMRTQWTYDLNIDHLANGIDTGSNLVSNVTAADCFYIARAYIANEFLSEATEWLQQALYKIDLGDTSISRQVVLQYIIPSRCYTGDIERTQASIVRLLRRHPRSKLPIFDKILLHRYNEMASLDCNELFNITEDYRTNVMYEGLSKDLLELHKRLCSREEVLSNRLRCRYEHYRQPHLRFQPFKLEQLQLDPPVLRFYDVISDNETREMKQIALKTMKAASTVLSDGSPQESNYRTSMVAWLYSGLSDVSDRLTRRMAAVTQLNVQTAEDNQLSRYSISGEYLMHNDYLFYSGKPFIEDRIATLMFYLNDVKEGGNTIFNYWNLTVKPVKNSAVLWFNYLPSGQPDPGSLHSGCPVVQGTKWVLNKWFHNEGHEFTKPCGLRKTDSFSHYYA